MATRNMLSRPVIAGNKRVSPLYQTMGVGITTPILLIGHANAPSDPYQVVDMQQAINHLGADEHSPLVKGLLEAYNAGCKDIWVYPVAPMYEYERQPGDRYEGNDATPSQNFYQLYYDRLAEAYAILRDHDFYDIVVPLEAPFYDSGDVDFLTQLADFCADSFTNTGNITLGVMGTRVPNREVVAESATNYNDTTIQEMIDDTRITTLGEKGKFIMVTVGEGVFMHPQIATVYSRSLEVATAAMMATTPLDRAISGQKVPGVASTSHGLFTDAQIEALAQAKLNSIYKTARGRRGFSFETKVLTDNTLGSDGSDYWSMSQMRIIATIANTIRDYGYSFIGEPDHGQFKQAVKSYLDNLKRGNYIVNYSLKITMETVHKAVVELGITPLFGIRNILFTVETGPGA